MGDVTVYSHIVSKSAGHDEVITLDQTSEEEEKIGAEKKCGIILSSDIYNSCSRLQKISHCVSTISSLQIIVAPTLHSQVPLAAVRGPGRNTY